MLNKPKLTIGMACHSDFDGVYFSIQALRLAHAGYMSRVEILVVDNNPDTPEGAMTKNFLGWVRGDVHSARYIPMPTPVGTSAPRQRIFDEAEGEIVLCMDSHVLIQHLHPLFWFYEQNPYSQSLLSGPMLYDDLVSISTHFDDVWRSEMWGVWGTDPRAVFNSPQYIPSTPFEIPAQGLGLFACRKDAWLGFNPNFRGFGGEEFYIHEKFRQAGLKCLCIPELRWVHRFGRPHGVKYPLTVWNKVRNYVIGHAELGLPFDNIKKEFLDKGRIPQWEWDVLMANPSDPPEMPTPPPIQKQIEGLVAKQFWQHTPPQRSLPRKCGAKMDALEEAYERGWKTPSDINEHAPKLRELASQVKRVTEFGMRPEVNTVAFLAAIPEELHSYGHVPDSIYKLIPNGTRFHPSDRDSLQETITETDLLFLDTVHTGDRIKAELERHHSKVTRYIVVHDTHTFGQRGEDGGPGLMVGIVHFLQTHPEWQIAYMTQANNGLAVLSRNQEDWPDTPFVMFSPGKGPGTEMKGILSSLGINPAPGCDCNAKAAQMDTWGVEGCRERRGTIVEGIKKNAAKWGWTGFAAAAVKAVTTGLATRINPFDPYGSLVDEAIRRAEEKEQKEATRD